MRFLNQSEILGTNEAGTFQITVDVAAIRDSGYLNMTGAVYADRKYRVFLPIQAVFSSMPIVTDTDLIAHDQYLEKLDRTLPIVFVINESPASFNVNDKTVYGASKKRLERAQEKLHAEGFTCVHIVTKKQAEATIRKAVAGRLPVRTLNVISMFSKKAV